MGLLHYFAIITIMVRTNPCSSVDKCCLVEIEVDHSPNAGPTNCSQPSITGSLFVPWLLPIHRFMHWNKTSEWSDKVYNGTKMDPNPFHPNLPSIREFMVSPLSKSFELMLQSNCMKMSGCRIIVISILSCWKI